MQQRQLGASQLEVSSLGLGCMGMSMCYGPFEDEQSIKTIHHAMARGISFLDTADVYGNGINETLLQKALAGGRRNHVVLASKCGLVGRGKVNASPDYIKKACDFSLKRLGTEVIDLYYLHRADKNIPIEESIGAFADLVSAGKVRYVGLSEITAPTLRRAVKVHPITAVQSEYSLWERKPEREILQLCRELNIGFVAYSPLGRGFLSGKYRSTDPFDEDDFRRLLPKFQPANLQHNLQLLDKLIEFAKDKGCTPAQLALAWLLAQEDWIVPIPGTRSALRLDENIGALDVCLSAADLEELNRLIPSGSVSGAQYPVELNLEV